MEYPITYEHGKLKASIYKYEDNGQYVVLIDYDGRDRLLSIKRYTKLSSAKRGLKRTLCDIAWEIVSSDNQTESKSTCSYFY